MTVDRIIYPPIGNPQGNDPPTLPNPANRILVAWALVAAAVGIASLAVAAWAWWHIEQVGWIYAFLPVWVLGPPIWFWCDYFLVYRTYGDPEAFDSFKHSQQISLAIWAGLALFLAGLANAEHFKPEKTTPSVLACTPTPGAAMQPASGLPPPKQ